MSLLGNVLFTLTETNSTFNTDFNGYIAIIYRSVLVAPRLTVIRYCAHFIGLGLCVRLGECE